MGLLVVLLIVAALVVGGVGLVVEGLVWMVIIGAALLLVGVVLGARQRGVRGRRRTRT